MIKISRNEKGAYRLGLFGGSVKRRHPGKFLSWKVVEPGLENKPEGMYRMYFLDLFVIVFSVRITFHRKIG
jgi:hypothetical protein